MSKSSRPTMIATLLITGFVHNTAFAQTADYQSHQLVNRLAKTERAVRVQPNNTLGRNAVRRNRMAGINSYCRFDHRETDPDPRVRLQLARDCKWYEDDTSD
jgi:hypothetical protein